MGHPGPDYRLPMGQIWSGEIAGRAVVRYQYAARKRTGILWYMLTVRLGRDQFIKAQQQTLFALYAQQLLVNNDAWLA